ncbi:uncharacterized protein BKA78DRAFT_89076 [Phyllosticta capitalensis]|uniref:Uncharacterized protein n=1 Tax=Phyllosticta capitalensis TaxID=121624 RepID=A0ABR1Z0Q3_9PEZI
MNKKFFRRKWSNRGCWCAVVESSPRAFSRRRPRLFCMTPWPTPYALRVFGFPSSSPFSTGANSCTSSNSLSPVRLHDENQQRHHASINCGLATFSLLVGGQRPDYQPVIPRHDDTTILLHRHADGNIHDRTTTPLSDFASAAHRQTQLLDAPCTVCTAPDGLSMRWVGVRCECGERQHPSQLLSPWSRFSAHLMLITKGHRSCVLYC